MWVFRDKRFLNVTFQNDTALIFFLKVHFSGSSLAFEPTQNNADLRQTPLVAVSQAARQLTNISNLILKSQIWLPQRYMTLEQSILDAKFNVHEPHDFFLLAFFSWCQSTMQIWVKSCRLCRRRWKFLRTLKYHISNEFKFTQACSGRGEKNGIPST